MSTREIYLVVVNDYDDGEITISSFTKEAAAKIYRERLVKKYTGRFEEEPEIDDGVSARWDELSIYTESITLHEGKDECGECDTDCTKDIECLCDCHDKAMV